VLKGDDKAAIDKKAEALMQASGNIAQQAAAAQAGAGGDAGAQGAPGGGASGSSSTGKGNDDAVDAEFEEVKDKKKAS
jgi:molecular chaperone DnaK